MNLLRAAAVALAVTSAPAPAGEAMAPARDLAAAGARAGAQGAPLVLLFSADYCAYCEQVKEEFLEPMAASGHYRGRMLVREVTLDAYRDLRGFDGEAVTPGELASRYGVGVTPTLVFVGPRGRELAPPLVGITTEDYYPLYLDAALARARNRLQGETP